MSLREDLEALLQRRGNVTTRELRRVVERAGYEHVRTTGGHHIYRKPGRRTIVVPESLKAGTAAAVLRQLLRQTDEEDDA